MKVNTVVLNEERNVTLSCYLLGFGSTFRGIDKRPAIIVIPGGGYRYCSEREADPVATYYLNKGFQTFILNYSVDEYMTWPNPLEDYENAMKYILNNSEELGIYKDKIAVVGFSAGGHLAGMAATISKHKPNAAILVYSLLTDDVKEYNPLAPSVVDSIDNHTCPLFFAHSRTDNTVSVMNTIKAMEKATLMGVPFESHVYSFGSHGFSSADDSVEKRERSERTKDWLSDSVLWLREVFGTFKDGSIEGSKLNEMFVATP